jgi:tetratricopeptide (TPR) repeat protein
MNQDVVPPPEPDPSRLSLESLEEKLRALPLAAVPDGMPSKLVAAIPPTTAVSATGSGVQRRWPWIGAVGVMCITASAVVCSWLVHLNSKPAAVSNENREPSTIENEAPRSSKAVQDYEQAVRFDPYNADAWFSLAKAQADVRRSADAISSAQKAIDIGRSRNRTAFVDTVEAWLRSYRDSESRRSSP